MFWFNKIITTLPIKSVIIGILYVIAACNSAKHQGLVKYFFVNIATKYLDCLTWSSKLLRFLRLSESINVFTFANNNDLISFRHHVYNKPEYNEVELSEVGPRFDLKPY